MGKLYLQKLLFYSNICFEYYENIRKNRIQYDNVYVTAVRKTRQ